jgi:hypothetical protein
MVGASAALVESFVDLLTYSRALSIISSMLLVQSFGGESKMSVAPKLPLPSVCVTCRTTIHPSLVRSSARGGHQFSRKRVVAWFHDASLAIIIRKGGKHEAIPDLSYAPLRARVVGPALVSAVEATRDWRVTPVLA